MKTTKKFDCVRMKHEIQERIFRENAGLSEKEINRIQMDKIKKDPILGDIVNRIRQMAKREAVPEGKK
ncbi:hypothetical protein ACFL4W_04790 [Planctomycetota bacterium]